MPEAEFSKKKIKQKQIQLYESNKMTVAGETIQFIEKRKKSALIVNQVEVKSMH